ncbi:MAG: hypothetical protein M5U26_21130 [Planctomycetota bacterium]|nr:hypothetical protein [Planctomycetota bacterium]
MLDALKDQPEVQAPPEGQPPQPDPKDVMKGLEKAIELAPQAVERQAKALEHLKAARRLDAYPEAEEARRILEEIAKAQPRNPQDPQQDQNKQDPNKQDPQQQDQQKQDPQPQDRHNPDPQKEGSQPQAQPQGEQAPSPEQIEALLRRVREREQDRRRKLDDIRGLLAPPDAEKDW